MMIIESGIIFAVILVMSASVLAGRHVKNTSDFLTGGGRTSTLLTAGGIVGTLIGSQSTLGTAQLAFTYGISAWWFTLGTGLGCLILAVMYSDRLRNSGCTTQFQIIANNYGNSCGRSGAILCTTGTFVSVLAQVIACIGFISALYPSLSHLQASVITIILMCLYIVSGGTWGAGMGGIVKLILLYASCAVCMILAVIKAGGVYEIFSGAETMLLDSNLGSINHISNHSEFISRYLSMSSRGILKDYGSCVSLMLGILSTQTYMQFILSAKGSREAKASVLCGLFLVPPVGIAGILIGVFMRSHYILQSEVNMLLSMNLPVPDMPVIANTIQIFPTFIIDYISPVMAGLMLGTLLITVVGGSSGLLLGISAIVTEDILSSIRFIQKHKLLFSRIAIIITLTVSSVIANIIPVQTINDLGFLSMTLRSSVVFMPLTCALWLGERISSRFILASIILSPVIAILSVVSGVSIEPLFIGMCVSIMCCIAGFMYNCRKRYCERIVNHDQENHQENHECCPESPEISISGKIVRNQVPYS